MDQKLKKEIGKYFKLIEDETWHQIYGMLQKLYLGEELQLQMPRLE